MDDPIPPLLPADQMPPIRDGRTLLAHWRAMMGKLGFSERLLWVMFVRDDGTAERHVTQVADLPTYPDEPCLDGLGEICSRIIEDFDDIASVAMLLSRPGTAAVTTSDRVWAAGLTRTAGRHQFEMHPVHLANNEQVRVFAPDDLIGVC